MFTKHYIILFKKALLSLLIFFNFSCNKSNNDKEILYSLKEVNSIVVSLPFEYQTHATMEIQCYEREDTLFSMVADFDNHKLLEIDLTNKLLNRIISIDFLKKDIYPVFLFHYFTRDSILIIRDESNVYGDHEKVFMFINGSGDIIKYLDISDSEFSSLKKKDTKKSYSFVHDFLPMVVSEDKKLYIFPWPNSFSRLQQDSLRFHQIPLLGYFDLTKTNPNFTTLSYINPFPTDLNFSSKQRVIHSISASSSELQIAYAYQNHPHKYFVENDSILTRENEPFKLINKPTPIKQNGAFGKNLNLESSKFVNMLHDKINGVTLRFSTIPIKKIDDNISRKAIFDFHRENQFFAVYDKDLKLLGEGLKPKEFRSSQPTPGYHDGAFISMKQVNKSTIQFNFHQIKQNIVSKVFIDSIKNYWNDFALYKNKGHSLKQLLNELRIESESMIVIIPPAGCPQCKKNTIKHFALNQKDLINLNAYLIFSEKNKGLFESERIIYEALEGENERIFILEDEILREAISINITNPTFLFWKNGKIEKQYSLSIDDSQEIQVVIEEFIKTLSTRQKIKLQNFMVI